MALAAVTEDYYLVLKVDQSATTDTITKSYKKLALLLHPDRNRKHDATEAFQLLGRAYETLKDESKRRIYDLSYPQIKCKTKSTSQPAPQTKPKQDDVSEEIAAIAAIDKAKAERAANWAKSRKMYGDKIFELKRDVKKLQAAIREIKEVERVEKDEEAAAKGWGRWLLSPIYGRVIETEEEKEEKERKRIGRMHNIMIKKMELGSKKEALESWEKRLGEVERMFLSENEKDDKDKGVFEERIRVKVQRVQWERGRVQREKERIQRERERVEREARERAQRERMEKERIERESRAKALREQQERQYREYWQEREAEEKRKRDVEEAARKKREEEMLERVRKRNRAPREDPATYFGRAETSYSTYPEPGFDSTARSQCIHEGWWNKVEGRMACERCGVSHYSYLLQCPGCMFKACASCQQVVRPPKRYGNKLKTDQARHHRETTGFGSTYDDTYGYAYDS